MPTPPRTEWGAWLHKVWVPRDGIMGTTSLIFFAFIGMFAHPCGEPTWCSLQVIPLPSWAPSASLGVNTNTLVDSVYVPVSVVHKRFHYSSMAQRRDDHWEWTKEKTVPTGLRLSQANSCSEKLAWTSLEQDTIVAWRKRTGNMTWCPESSLYSIMKGSSFHRD